jgi:tripartite-type tricarboxylate transporter receptor subunit TctC
MTDRPVIVVENDPFPRLLHAFLGSEENAARTTAIADFVAHDGMDLPGWLAGVRARAGPDGHTLALVDLPEVPTVAESGFPGLAVDNQHGVVTASGTLAPIVDRINRAFLRVLGAPDIRERLVNKGYDPVGDSPAAFSAYLRTEVSKWAQLIRTAGLRAA